MYHGPFPFAREAVPPARSLRQSWKCFPTPVPVVITQEPEGGGGPLSQRIARFLYTTAPAGPWGVSLGRRRVGGYRGNEIFFMCRVLCASGSPYSANESFFYVGIFRRFGRGKGPFPAGRVPPFPPVREEGPSPGLHRPLRACMRETFQNVQGSRLPARSALNGAHRAPAPPSKAVSAKPAFSDGGSRYRPGKGKRLPTFFPKKSSPFCASQHPHSAAFLEEPAEGQHLFLYRN